MKILHTSDWHIGKKLYKKDLEEDHIYFFNNLIKYIKSENVNSLIISGDIFDIAYPSNSSLKLYYGFLMKLLETNCKNVFIIGGNHDSVSTLEAPKEILKILNINIIGGMPLRPEDLIFTVKYKNNGVHICAVPYLRDSNIRKSVIRQTHTERKKALQTGIGEYYTTVADIVKKKKDKFPVIVTGHLFMTGVSKSDSERDIHVGNLDGIRLSNMPDIFDYWALGHIHRPQIINGKENIRYSGSPIPLSFSERNDKKQIIIITILENKISDIKPVEITPYRKLIKITGTYNEVIRKIGHYKSKSAIKNRADILIIEENYDPSIVIRFEEYSKTVKNIEILNYKIHFKDRITGTDDLFDKGLNLNELKVNDVFNKRLEKEGISQENKKELMLAFNEVIEEIVR